MPILVSFEVVSHRLNHRKQMQRSKQTQRQRHCSADGSRIYIGETDAGRRRRPFTVQIPNQRLIPRLTRPNPNPNMMASSGYEFSGAALSNLLVHWNLIKKTFMSGKILSLNRFTVYCSFWLVSSLRTLPRRIWLPLRWPWFFNPKPSTYLYLLVFVVRSWCVRLSSQLTCSDPNLILIPKSSLLCTLCDSLVRLRATPTTTLQKHFSHPSLVILHFQTPPAKLKLWKQMGGRPLIPYHQSKTGSSTQIIFITLFSGECLALLCLLWASASCEKMWCPNYFAEPNLQALTFIHPI
jgi:hypothetical protein